MDTCGNMLQVQNCSSSIRKTGYKCKNLFDGKNDTSSAFAAKDWVKLNLNDSYNIDHLMILLTAGPNYRPRKISLEFSNGSLSDVLLINLQERKKYWNNIVLPENTLLNYVNLTIGRPNGGPWAYIPEIEVYGCRTGKEFLQR